MNKKQLIVIWILILLNLSGCVTTETIKNFTDRELASYRQSHWGEGVYESEMARRRKMAVNNHSEWREEIKKAVLGGEVLIGMTEEQVIACWGKPDKINTTVTSFVKHEQWIYGYRDINGYWIPKYYLYFENGILTSFQH